MTDETDNFQEAYRLATVDDDVAGALSICSEILNLQPGHFNARMLEGCLLADSSDSKQRLLGRNNFLFALKALLCDTGKGVLWLEENPRYQLALWERKNGNSMAAAIMFAIDYVMSQTQGSREQMYELANEGLSSKDWDRVKETLDAILQNAENTC